MTLNCKQVQRQLSNYVDQQLTPKLKVAIDHHLGGCNFCQHALESLTRTKNLLQYYVAPSLPNPDRVMTDLQVRIEERTISFDWWRALGSNIGRQKLSAVTYARGFLVLLTALLLFRGLMKDSPTTLMVSNFSMGRESFKLSSFSKSGNGRNIFAPNDCEIENQRFDRLISATSHAANQQLEGSTISNRDLDWLAVSLDQSNQLDSPLKNPDLTSLNNQDLAIDSQEVLTVLSAGLRFDSEQVGADASALFAFSYSTPPQSRLTRINRLSEVFRDMVVPLKQDLTHDINFSLSGL